MGLQRSAGPPPLHLPGSLRSGGNMSDVKEACIIFEGVVGCNAHAVVGGFPEGDPRQLFVSSRRDAPQEVSKFVKMAVGLCSKSWPCVLWMCDAAARRAGLPVAPQTARRMITAAVFLLLSTEDDEGHALLARMARRRPADLSVLGQGLLQLLEPSPPADTLSRTSSDSLTDSPSPPHVPLLCGTAVPHAPHDGSWEEQIGMQHIGWVRGILPRSVEAVSEVCRQAGSAEQFACTRATA
eukprot:TRINITY_DN3808_c0_g1_i1.p1 TRINITY_DN3808_c0_g1~~TRINITY_DN3808_c0_g1_i1.p1  ORF type:complete len:239 (+),score=39.78 TRINITY_DN3808_c0_g1_i1:99-815(+)